jgi:FkbM family methyltransferase
MIFINNYLLLLLLRFSNKFGRGLVLKKWTFSSENILKRNFPENKDFNFIQVGANDGISFDFLYSFVVKRKSKGIVIEPISDYYNELENNYREFIEIIKVKKAVHPFEKIIEINKISPNAMHKYPKWVKGIASIDVKHHLKTGIRSNDMVKELVEAETLMNIVSTNLIKTNIDYFQVDTEGFDYEVLKQLDFKVLSPLIIKYEQVNLNQGDKIKLENLLKSHKYFLFDELGDKVAINLKKIKLY